MRLIGTLQNENDAKRLSSYLHRQHIENGCEVSFDPQSGHMSYQIWCQDEDRLSEAEDIFALFVEKPSNPRFDLPLTQQPLEEEAIRSEEEAPPKKTFFTTFIIALCTLIFMMNVFEEYPIFREGLTDPQYVVTPVETTLLFDVPPVITELNDLVQKHQLKPDQKVETLSPEIRAEIAKIEKTPFWRGAYGWVLLKLQGKDTSLAEGPLFEKIREGEVWRLFSPALLHGGIFHILFNMIWVWMLSRPIEQRIGIFRLILLTLIAGIGANVIQYLMSGPFFLGYSGIVTALAGFTWVREKVAPWEGYPLHRMTILFLLLFIGSMFAIQSVSFILQIFTKSQFEPNIANAAHIGGALIGAALGRMSYFAARGLR